jgi:hypothetical protein
MPRVEAGELAEAPIATPESYERIGRFELNSGLPLLQVQWDVYTEARSLIGCFGSWRSGKTRAGALRIARCAFENGWRSIYGRASPFGIVISETNKVLADATMPELLAAVPRDLILRVWDTVGNQRVRWVNGHDTIFRTWSGAIEGQGACGVWLDEAHKLDGPEGPEKAWSNYVMRATDPRGVNKCVIATGLPEFGYLSERFDVPANDERVTYLCSLLDNFYLDPADIRRLRASTSAEEAETLILGRWRKPSDVIFYAFEEGNLANHGGNPRLPVDISIDLGDRGCILVSQRIVVRCMDDRRRPYRSNGVLIVDELLPDAMSVREALRQFLSVRKWRFTSESKVYVDPKADRDELEAIRDILGAGKPGGPHLVRKPAKADAYKREYGYRCINSAFRDLDGNRRLYINRNLPRGKRSVITAMRRFRRRPDGKAYRDNWVDHAADCLRYVVSDQLPLLEGGVRVRAA